MKKIIAAFDGLNFSQSTLNYALFLASGERAHLVGVFLDDFTRHSYSMADITHYQGSFETHIQSLNRKEKMDREEAVDLFEQACRKAKISFSVHRDQNIALHDLLHESVYSDLVVINGRETLSRYEEAPPTRFIRDFLSDVQCPVLVVPETFQPPDKIVLLYDGEPSSVHAVKMFSYTLPGFLEVETEVVSVKSEEESAHLPDNRLMKEFMKRHYPGATYTLLKGLSEDRIVSYLSVQKKNALVVLGAYRRGKISRVFRPSMADALMKHIRLPLFIAHNK